MKKIETKKTWIFWTILTITIIGILLLANYTVSINSKLYTSGIEQKETGVIENVEVGTKIEQSFIAIDNNLEKITIDFEPYKSDEKRGGIVKIEVKDNDGNVIGNKEISRNYVREKTKYELKFKKQKDSKDKEYKIVLEFIDLKGAEQFYSVKYTNNNEFDKNKLIINGEEQSGESIIFKDFYKSSIRTKIWFISLTILTILIYVIATIIKKYNLKMENIFLLIAPIICIFFMITMPTFKNHDEYYHWLKAYEVSEGHLMTPIENGIQGSMMPKQVSEVLPKDWTTMDYREVKERLKIQINEDDKEILNPETAAVYSFVQYVPQATGIAIARLFTNNAYIITYAGRFLNMIVAIAILYFAIKIIPFGKKMLLIPAMIPIAIEGFTSLSPDAITISMAFLYIAYILHLAFDKKVEKIKSKDKIALLIMSIIIALCKIVYIPLVGLLLIIPKEKFKDNKNKIINFIVIAGIAVVINLIWLAISSRYLSTFREGDSKIQVLLALQNPIQFIQQFLYTLNINSGNYILSLFGADLGWGELVKINTIVPYCLLGIYVFTAITDNKLKNRFEVYQIVWISLVVLAIIALVFASLYVQWTTIGNESIIGVQGRYFLPIIPLIMLLLGNCIKVKSTYNEKNINKFVGISILTLNLYTISQILMVHL